MDDFPEYESDLIPTVYQIDFVKEQLSKMANDPNVVMVTRHAFIDTDFDMSPYDATLLDEPSEKKPDWE